MCKVYRSRMENCGRYFTLILILIISSCTVQGRYSTRHDRLKQKYYNSLQLNDKMGQERYSKKLKKSKKKKKTEWTHNVKEI